VARFGRITDNLALPVVAAAVLVVGSLQLSRPGYSADEEFTVFAVHGITATGLPLLPSSLVYDRGLAYAYASWVGGALTGLGLPAYRAIALVSAVAALIILFAAVQRWLSPRPAAIALILVATSLPFWAAATTARFYAPFLVSYLTALLYLGAKRRNPGTLGSTNLGTMEPWNLGTVSFLTRLTHELAFTLVAIPLLGMALSRRGQRARRVRPTLAVLAGLLAAQAGILALHYLAPASGATMINRFFVWQVLNLFETPPDRQFGLVLIAMVIAWLIAPRRARSILVIALCGVSFIVSLSVARALTIAPFSWALVASVLDEGSRYPLDMFWHIVRVNPVTITVAVGLLVARLAGVGGEWRPIERAAHFLWIGWVVWFGVMESGITINYLLLPISLMLVAIAVDIDAILKHRVDAGSRSGRFIRWAVCTLVIAGVAADQWRGEGSVQARLEAARPTIDVAGIEEIRESLRPGDRVVCTDELGCLMLVGRIDAWLALDDYVRERFVVRKADGQPVGVYTGRPAVFRPADLFDDKAADRTIIVDVFKEYAVGSSRDWLPRALARDGVEVQPLLETAQVRVVEISPPVHNALR
jgi:hypothetical protein